MKLIQNNMMKARIVILTAALVAFFTPTWAQVKELIVKSPDGKLEVKVSNNGKIEWDLTHDQTLVIAPSAISLTLSTGEVLGQNAVLRNSLVNSVNSSFTTPVYKKSAVTDRYNQLTLNFKGDFGLIFRVYNDGAAYRFFTKRKGEITIKNEQANFNFTDDDKAYLPFVNDYRNKDKFTTSFEAHYGHINLSSLTKDSLAFLPALVELAGQKKAVILEADLQDYPGMYLSAGSGNGMTGVFARYPTAETTGGYHNIDYVVNDRANYIAKNEGTRSFPWRVVIVSSDDKQLADNDMVQKLSPPSRVTDQSWIKPGKVAWDWWNNWNITHVDFKAGINVPTYKYYIDFAAANKLEYVIMDEGWSEENDLNQLKIDVQQVVDYGRQKNVGIILWSSWYALHLHADSIFSKYSKMGIKGFKIDFIDRDDQKMVRSLYEIAQKAADNHLLVDYHGMFKPSGMQRVYPNIINFEGVKGLENMKWGTDNQPDYDVSIPFIRMIAGPMDYTPGAMRNANKADYVPNNSNPMSQGTRCHQLGMYVVFEEPLAMLADNPTIYKREQECTDFIAKIPTTFDETIVLDGKVGKHIAIARKKAGTWYIGAMSGWTGCDITLDMSFLGAGNYEAEIFRDGKNAGNDATDYKKDVVPLTSQDRLNVKLADGGWLGSAHL